MSAPLRRLKTITTHLLEDEDAGQEKHPGMLRSPCLAPTKAFPSAQDMSVFPDAVHDILSLENLLSSKAKAIRDKTRAFAVKELAPVIAQYWEKAEFPFELVPKIAPLNLGGGTLAGYGCPGLTVTEFAMAIVELARVDASFSTFLMVHNCLAMLTIGLLGSESQKKEWLPKMASLETIGCWGLTEPSNGSDASALQTRAEWVPQSTHGPGFWRLSGQKRWIGNGTFAGCTVIWARNMQTNQVNAFIVRKGAKGLSTHKIDNKISLRCVQNADILMDGVEVPESDRLPGVNSFKDTNKVLAISRIMVAWQPVGIAAGVYDMCVRYTKERHQFQRPIAAFQIQQERLARMAGAIQGMWLLGWRLSELHEQGSMSHEQASLVKAQITLRCREVVSLGREILGGNGIISDWLVAKAFCDLEAIYTYEGTYDINSLVAGRGITGVAAFKAR